MQAQDRLAAAVHLTVKSSFADAVVSHRRYGCHDSGCVPAGNKVNSRGQRPRNGIRLELLTLMGERLDPFRVADGRLIRIEERAK